MSPAQMTFLATTGGLTLVLVPLFYAGVRKHASSRRDSALAAAMAATLCATPVGLLLGAVVNAMGAA